MFEVEILVLKLKEGKTFEYLHYKEFKKIFFQFVADCKPHRKALWATFGLWS